MSDSNYKVSTDDYKLSTEEVSVEVNLEALFGTDIKDAGLRRLIAESFVEKIVNRAQKGEGVNISSGYKEKLKSPYSKAYANSLEFKAYGKKEDQVNMTLTGSMLSSIDLIQDNSKTIKIGIDNEEAPKAFNHQTGDKTTKRPFFGITNKDVTQVYDEFVDQVVVEPQKQKITVDDIFSDVAFAKVFKELKKRGVLGL